MSTTKQHSTRRQRVHHEEEEGHANHERWLLTYADMITLLMVLFIVMFAISQVDQKKFATLAEGLAHAFGGSNKVVDGNDGLLPGAHTTADETALDAAVPSQLNVGPAGGGTPPGNTTAQHALEQAQAEIMAALHAHHLDNAVEFTHDARGLVVSIVTDHVLFPSGSAALEPKGREVLQAIGPALAKLPNDVIVEGHTDNVAIRSSLFPSNWELSAVRATTVLRFLISDGGVAASRLSAAGYADQRGLVPNDTPADRARNRRVAIVVLATNAATSTSGPAAATGGVQTSIVPDLAHPMSTSALGSGGR